MAILAEAAETARKALGSRLDSLVLERLVVGIFFTGVKLSCGRAGICYTPVKDIPQAVCCPSSAGRILDPRRLSGLPVERLLDQLDSPEPLKAAAALAALNALQAHLLEQQPPADYVLVEERDALELIRIPRQAEVVVVGALVPALGMLKKRGGPWWVVEQDPRTLKGDELEHYLPFSQSGEVLARAQVLIITGVTLLNRTLEPILEAARPGAEIAVLGPSASLPPQPLFQRGVRLVGGVRVRRPDDLLDCLAAAGSGYHFFDRMAPRMVMLSSCL